jgi:hypothetical protein
MRNDQDPVIRRLFAEQGQGLPSDDFMLQLGKRMDKRQRVRSIYRILAMIACLVLSILCAPWVAQITSTLIELTVVGINATGPLSHGPLTWLVVGATTAGCSPVIYLWRTGRW